MEKQKILKMHVNVIDLSDAVKQVLHLTKQDKGAYVCVSNVHMCMETFDSESFRSIVNQADVVIPDGKPLSVTQKMFGHKYAGQVRGQDIMNALCGGSGDQEINIGFYGGSSEEILELVQTNLKIEYPNIRIVYAFSPPFRSLTDEEDKSVIEEISTANVDVLFVGIGCPKQEIWMAEHRDKVNCVMLGVGAAFDFIAGHKKHAPRWVQKVGMEWGFRLATEPKRLWKRYLKHNPRFVYHFGRQIFRERYFDRRKEKRDL